WTWSFENGCTLWSLRFLEVQISGFQLISQEYLDFTQDSNQKRQNQKKSIHRFNRRFHFSIRRLNAVSRVWTGSIHRLNRCCLNKRRCISPELVFPGHFK